MPSVPQTWVPASLWSLEVPERTTASGATGPPIWTGSSEPGSSARAGTASATLVSDARPSTTPIAPSGVCSITRITVRRK